MWDNRSDLIKSGPSFFHIFSLIALHPSQSYFHFGLFMLCLIELQLVKFHFGGYGLFSIDINNPNIILACVGSWQTFGEFGRMSRTRGIWKSSSHIRLKPIIFPADGNWILYVIIVACPNGVEEISSSHGIRFSWSLFWSNPSGSCWSIK